MLVQDYAARTRSTESAGVPLPPLSTVPPPVPETTAAIRPAVLPRMALPSGDRNVTVRDSVFVITLSKNVHETP